LGYLKVILDKNEKKKKVKLGIDLRPFVVALLLCFMALCFFCLGFLLVKVAGNVEPGADVVLLLSFYPAFVLNVLANYGFVILIFVQPVLSRDIVGVVYSLIVGGCVYGLLVFSVIDDNMESLLANTAVTIYFLYLAFNVFFYSKFYLKKLLKNGYKIESFEADKGSLSYLYKKHVLKKSVQEINELYKQELKEIIGKK